MYRKNGYVWVLAKDTTLNKNPMRLLTVPPRRRGKLFICFILNIVLRTFIIRKGRMVDCLMKLLHFLC